MATPPLTPLGKPLSQNALSGENVPVSTDAQTPISAFQWLSLARATWMWILRPLWYLCVVFPTKLFRIGWAMGAESEDEYNQRQRRRWQMEHDDKYNYHNQTRNW